jgi:2-keto-3-deoxy-L-rhamnonate aldolase RhmA
MFGPGNLLKTKLARGETTLGLWVTLESPTITEIAVMLGLDWIVIDTEHGHLDLREVVEHLRATRGSTTTPLVRIPEISVGIIKRVLDLGAHGILVPQVNSAADVARSVFLGPADYSASAGYLGHWEGPGVAEALLGFKDVVRSRGLGCGILSTGVEDARKRREEGFGMIGLGADAGLLIRSLQSAIEAMR